MDRLTKFILAFAVVFLLVIIILGIFNRGAEQERIQPAVSSAPPASKPTPTMETTTKRIDEKSLEELKQIKPEDLTEAQFNAIVEELRKKEEKRLQALGREEPSPKPLFIPAEEDSARREYPLPMEDDEGFLLPPEELPKGPAYQQP